MITAAWVVGVLACYVLTWRMATLALYRASKRAHPSLYDNSEWRYRDAPQGDVTAFAAFISLFFPVVLPVLLVLAVVRRFRGDPEQRWLSQRARLAELERERAEQERRHAAIIAELEREYGTPGGAS